MKTYCKVYIAFLFVCIFFVGCTHLDGDEDISFSPRNYHFSSDGGEMTFTLEKKKYSAWYFTNAMSIPVDEKLHDFFTERHTFTGSESSQVEGDNVSFYKDSQNNIHVTMSRNDTGEERMVVLKLEESNSTSVPHFGEVIFYQDK